MKNNVIESNIKAINDSIKDLDLSELKDLYDKIESLRNELALHLLDYSIESLYSYGIDPQYLIDNSTEREDFILNNNVKK